ncbi:MAG TPA: hypothetical protein VGD45_16140 [Steroidobacter sp.]|uniref:hypothetical protein n=1 Tax=Steroidobacter sp. TaxID=1978227 RepID=UPI002EDB3872
MNQATMFRLFVVASFAMAILGEFLDYLIPGLIPTDLDDAYVAWTAAEEPTMSYVLALGALSLVLLIGAVAGMVGLLLFKPWSRWLSLWISVLAMLSYPFLGPSLYSGWATMLTEISMLLWGAALAMAYFGEIKVRFERASVSS